MAEIAAFHALKEFDSYYKGYIQATNTARVSFISDMRSRGLSVFNGGGGNFVCLKIPDKICSEDLCKRLEKKAIFVRDIGARFPGYIRITMGLDMVRVADAILGALEDIKSSV